MARSEEAEAFFFAVYQAIQEVPYGKVTSYAHIARLVGTPQRPRQVGVCLKHLPSDPSLPFHDGNVPWQRIINSKGAISARYGAPRVRLETGRFHPVKYVNFEIVLRGHPSGAANQARVLREEGVEVGTGSLGEFVVDFVKYGWFPHQLPSEAEAGLPPHTDLEHDES